MNDTQRKKIFDLRIKGLGYKAIAKEVDLTVDSVKAFCKRNNLKGYGSVVKLNYGVMQEKGHVCKFCNKQIVQKGKGRIKRFCSDYCRGQWWNENQDRKKKGKNKIHRFICPKCNKEFKSYSNKKRKFCSRRCYMNFRFEEGDNGIESS